MKPEAGSFSRKPASFLCNEIIFFAAASPSLVAASARAVTREACERRRKLFSWAWKLLRAERSGPGRWMSFSRRCASLPAPEQACCITMEACLLSAPACPHRDTLASSLRKRIVWLHKLLCAKICQICHCGSLSSNSIGRWAQKYASFLVAEARLVVAQADLLRKNLVLSLPELVSRRSKLRCTAEADFAAHRRT